jgi:hypothetical protein
MQPHDLLLYSDILYVVHHGGCLGPGDFFAGISVQVIFFDNRAESPLLRIMVYLVAELRELFKLSLLRKSND